MRVSESVRRVSPLLVVLPFICFTAALYVYVVNVPWMDDVESFLGFMLEYQDARTLSDRVYWLFKPNNEHRILMGKLITVAMQAVTGEVNFRWIIFVSYLGLVGIALLFFRVFRRFSLPLIAFLPVTLILFQPEHYLTSAWAITGVQHLVTACLVFWAMYLLTHPTPGRLAGALALQMLASFSMSNGLFGWVAGLGVLLVQQRYRQTVLWGLTGVAMFALYFHGFSSPQGNETSVSFFLKHPHLVFLGFFTFSGGLFNFFPEIDIVYRSLLPTLFGLMVIPLALWMLKIMLLPWPRQLLAQDGTVVRRRLFFVGIYGFLLVNALAIAFLRPRFGYHVMLISNYMIYPALLTATLYLNVLSEKPEWAGRWLKISTAVAGLVWVVMYVNYLPALAERRQMLLTYAFNQKHNDIGLGALIGSDFAESMRYWMDESERRGIYHYPATFYSPIESSLISPGPVTAQPSLRFVYDQTPDSYWVYTLDWKAPGPLQYACVVAKSDRHTYLFPSPGPYELKPYFLRTTVLGLTAQLHKTALYPGTYRLGLLTRPGSGHPVFSEQTITIR